MTSSLRRSISRTDEDRPIANARIQATGAYRVEDTTVRAKESIERFSNEPEGVPSTRRASEEEEEDGEGRLQKRGTGDSKN